MISPEIGIGPETLEEKVRNQLAIIYGVGQLKMADLSLIPKETLHHMQGATKKASIKLTQLLEPLYGGNGRKPEPLP